MKKREIYQLLWKTLKQEEKASTAVITKGKDQGSRAVWNPKKELLGTFGQATEALWQQVVEEMDGKNGLRMINGEEVFVEYLTKQPKLVVCGGGHISKPICQMGKMLDFHVTVVDDREEFANEERFFMADQVICCDYEELLHKVPFAPNTYYIVVTRGHRGDTCCVRQLLSYPCTYLGMIGSRKKVAITKEKLKAEGFTEEEIMSLHAPIGLKIGAQTPAEIAVSILAEIIQVKNEKADGVMESSIGQQLEQEMSEGMMLTIVEKKGSSPRDVGSRRWICADGHMEGSIGGGNAEYMAIQEAMENLKKEHKQQIWQQVFDMTNRESANTGMICGGTVKVLFEYLPVKE